MSRPVVDPLLSLALLAGLCAATGGAWARTSDRSKPLDVEARSSDCTITDEGPCVFTGNVHLEQGTLVVDAARADVQRGGGDIRRVVLTGTPATLRQQLDNGSVVNARAGKVDYDLAADTVVFTGNARIDQPGRGSIAGERIAYNMTTGQVQSGGAGNGRVRMRILPKNAAPATPTTRDDS